MRIECGVVYVYSHSINGKIFYVGMGRGSRPFDSAGRNSIWRKIVSESGFFDVDLLGIYSCNDGAEKRERKLIKQLSPIANIMCNTLHHKKVSL